MASHISLPGCSAPLHRQASSWPPCQPWGHACITIYLRGRAASATACRQSQPLCAKCKDCKISSKLLTVFSSYLHGGPHSSSSHASPYNTNQDCHPQIPPTNSTNLHGSALVTCLTTKDHATVVIAQRHTNLHHTGKGGLGFPSQASEPQLHPLLSIVKMMHSLLPNSSLVLSCPCLGTNYVMPQDLSWGAETHPSTHPTKGTQDRQKYGHRQSPTW